jgi:RimJ/RimL family protein N-acetyltransferase
MRYFKKIPGERVYLSPINPDDVEIYTKWVNDPEVAKWIGMRDRVFSRSSERSALERMASGGQDFAIVRAEDDVLLGNTSLSNINHECRRASLGIFIGEAENHGRGYGTEAVRLLVDYGFYTLNLRNIMLTVNAENARAIACYKKAGFREFGRRTGAAYIDGEYVDTVYMEILNLR